MTRTCALLFTAVLSLGNLPILLHAQASGVPLTVEKIFGHGPLIGHAPDDIEWSPDGKHLSYIDSGELVDLDPGSGKPHVLVSRSKINSIQGAAASEQDRDHRSRYNMAAYQWAPNSRNLLFDANGRLWMYDLHSGTGVEIAFTGKAAGDDPKFSPNGEYVSFIRDHSLCLVRLKDSGTPAQSLVPAPNENVWNGEVDWVYEEELDVRSNYFWSPDSRSIAFLQTNESDVPLYPLTDWIPTHSTVALQHYPQPGDNNPDVRIGVIPAHGGKIYWIKLPVKPGQDYIPRFGWVDRKTIWAEVVTRDQKHRMLYFADVGTGVAHQVLDISDTKFLDENYNVEVDSGFIALTNWSDGHNHIYLYSYDRANTAGTAAHLEKQLTSGNFEVGEIYSLDTDRKQVYYASNEGAVEQQQVWQVSFSGERRQLTSGPGNHSASFSPDNSSFSDKFSSRMAPPTYQLCRAGGKCQTYWSTHAIDPYRLRAPEPVEVKAHDGTSLYGTLLLPAGISSPASVPLIVNPYGGPGPMGVADKWADALLFDELLAEHGFAVLHADNRGTGMRGREFAQAAYRTFGPVQLEDQLTVIDAVLARHPELDPKRLGWWGWSWGGTFTLYALSHSDRFRAGVSVAPVTDWRDYDSVYTERYMGLPVEFASGYHDFSVVNFADRLKGRLLLVHGTGDDNVHFENTVQYVQKLIDANLPYDLQIYPRKTHSIAGSEARTHLYNRILAHFERYLKPPVQ